MFDLANMADPCSSFQRSLRGKNGTVTRVLSDRDSSYYGIYIYTHIYTRTLAHFGLLIHAKYVMFFPAFVSSAFVYSDVTSELVGVVKIQELHESGIAFSAFFGTIDSFLIMIHSFQVIVSQKHSGKHTIDVRSLCYDILLSSLVANRIRRSIKTLGC